MANTTYKRDLNGMFEKISGAEFPTREAQQEAYSDIQQVGNIGEPGSYLEGVKRTAGGEGTLPTGGSQLPEANTPGEIFNLLMMDGLKKGQGVGSADLKKKRTALGRAAAGRTQEITPEEMRTMSPTQQAAIRSGKVGALQPEFDAINYEINKNQDAIDNYERVYMAAIKTSEDFKKTATAPDEIISNYQKAVYLGQDVGTIMQNMNDKTKQKFLDTLDWEKVKEAGEEDDKPSISEQLAAAEGGYTISDGIIQKANGRTDPITNVPTDPSKVIEAGGQSYDFTSYATDPNWGFKINNVINQLPVFSSSQEVDNYIQQNAPGSALRADDIQAVANEYGISPELLLSITGFESRFGSSNVAQQNNNFGGVTWNGTNGQKGTARPAAEGGNYVKYNTPQEGLEAVARNISRRQIDESQTSQTTKLTLDDLENTTAEENATISDIMRLLPTKLKDNVKEVPARQLEILADIRKDLGVQAIADKLKGFILEDTVSDEDRALADTLRAYAIGTDMGIEQIAAAINLNKPVKGMVAVENANLEEIEGNLKNVSTARGLVKNANRVLELLEEAPVDKLGQFDGRKFKVSKFAGLTDAEIQKTQLLETAIVNTLNEIRRESLGTAVTEAELQFLEPLLTSLLDQPEIIKAKMDELKVGTINAHNEARGTVNLPQVDEFQLLDNNKRLDLYRNLSGQDTNVFTSNDGDYTYDSMSDEDAYQLYINQ